MSIIKGKIIILFILLGFLLACNQKNSKSIGLQFPFSKEWKADTLGCLGIRRKIVSDNLIAIKKFIGINENDFIEVFGSPNSVKCVIDEKYYLYWVSCGIKPKINDSTNPINGSKINLGAAQLIIIINSQEIISEIKLIVP